MESSDIGLNSEVQLALSFLGIGTTVAIFHCENSALWLAQTVDAVATGSRSDTRHPQGCTRRQRKRLL